MTRLLLAVLLLATVPQDAPTLRLEKGDHVSIIGNTTADRMQHVGWLETVLQRRLPQEELAIRKLGFSADELTIRLRSANFGSPDQWLAKNQTDVILAFFGYNETLRGGAGVSEVKNQLATVHQK